MAAGLAAVLVAGAVGGWMFFRSDGGEVEPIVVGSTAAPTLVDPGGASDAGSYALLGNVFQSLLTFAPGQDQPVPDAAESCSFTDRELTVFRCTVREGLTFSNGNALTPEDVKFSYDRILAMGARAQEEARDPGIPAGEKFAYAGPIGLLTNLEAVRVNERDVIFELKSPDATFPFVVAGVAGSIVDRESYDELEPRTDGEAVGSGPYLLSAFEPGEYAELTPNPDFKPNRDDSSLKAVPEFPVTVRYFVSEKNGASAEDLLADAWAAGELDVNAGQMPPEEIAAISDSESGHLVQESTGGSIQVMAFNTASDGPLADRVPRQVVASLIDREALTRQVQRNTVRPLYSLIPSGFAGHSTPYYDQYAGRAPEALRQQLLDAGHALPVPFTLAYSRGAANHEEAEAIERQLEADGLFEVEIEYHEWSDFIPGIFGESAYDAYLIGWRADYPDPATFTDDLLGPGDGLNTGFRDEGIDALIAEARAEADRGRAAEDFRAIHELAAEHAPIIPIWQEKRIAVGEEDIAGLQDLQDNSGLWRLWALRRG